VAPKLWLDGFVTHWLLATWRKKRRRLVWVGRMVRRVDIRKPVHAVAVGVVVAGIVAPGLGWLADEARYRLASDQIKVMAHASQHLGDMLSYDKAADALYFNKDATADPNSDAGLAHKVGSGGKPNYTAKMPTLAGKGIALTDINSKVNATMAPQFTLMDGRKVDNRVLYPLKDGPGVLALTPKGNGIKEDIVLNGAPADRVQYDYKLTLDAGLEARQEKSGAIGVYSADPALFGNITYSSDADRARVENARKNADKTYLMFQIPAPVVKQTDGKSHGVKAHFMLRGDILSVVTTGLNKASFPLSIDPSFVITTQSDFLLGKVEDNITVTQTSGSDYQLDRAKITAGLTGTWSSTAGGGSSLGTNCGETSGANQVNFNFGLTAYNGFLYLVGGGNGANRFVCYAALNSNGTLGTWTAATSTFATGRIGSTVVGFNGYLYVMDGEDSTGNTQYKQVEFAPVTSTGDITAAWTNNSAYYTGTAHTFGAGVTYNGFIYMCAGATVKKDASLIATCEYTQINSDGTLQKPSTTCTLSGTATNWCTTSSITTARNRFGMAAYNGYIYIVGGYDGSAPITGSHSVMYSSIASDYTLGTWADNSTNFTSITALANGWRNGGVVAEEGHIYMVGGCTTAPACTGALNGVYYAVINADGTLGPFDTNGTTFTTARFFNGVASYNGAIYSIAGCTVEPTNANNCSTALGDSQYALITQTPGDTTGSTANNGGSTTSARVGSAVTAYNGYLYAAGGCNGTNCGTYTTTVDSAKINDDGSLAAWTTTGMGTLPASTGMNAGRAWGTMVGYGGKLYYIGGLQKTTAPADNYANTLLVATQTASNGNLSWAADNTASHAFINGRAYLASAVWGNYIYLIGGYDGTNYYNDVQYTSISGGSLTDPNSCGVSSTVWCGSGTYTFSATAKRGMGAAAYAGYLYVVGGRNGTTSYTDVVRAPLTNSTGAVGSFTSDTSLPSGPHTFIGVVIHNNVIYAMGGMTDNAGNAPSNVISCAPLDASTGAVGAWTACTRTLSAARWGAGIAAYNGRLFVVGGCSGTGVPPCATGSYLATTEFFLVRNGGNGMFGTTAANTNPWTNTAGCSGACSMTARGDFQSVAYNGNLYVVGGCTAYTAGACTTWSTKVEHATISASGSLGTFSSASDAQLSSGQARTNGALIAYVGRIFLIGGSSSTNADTADVISAPLTATGNVDTTQGWRTESSMPEARHGFGTAISGGRVYVTGGLNSTNYRANVLYCEIGENGTLINWLTDNTDLFTTGRIGHTTIAYNSVVYVIGGVDGSGNSLGDVQYAPINTDGSIGVWKFTNQQDQLARYRQAAAANGYMYFFGSETTGTDVFYAAINSNGTIGNLYRASNSGMLNAHPHGGVIFSDGFFYTVGGCTLSGNNCNTVTNTAEYAGQKAQARIGHYSKMFNTEVNTSPTLVQVNGTGQFVITLRTEAVGTTVWGVPQFISPAYASKFYFIQALDSTGVNVGIAFNYYLFLIIDDSNTGTFPDTASSATDVNIYYHPNPGRRLRHGASFTNTGCNRLVADGCLLDTAQ
jgi:hypothetical protein